MPHTSPIRAKRLSLLAVLGFMVVGTTAHALTGPPDPQVTAVASTTPGFIEVSWPDFAGENGYHIYRTTMSDPPPVLSGNSTSISVNTGWELSMDVPSNTTSASISAFATSRVAVCAYGTDTASDLMVCFGPSAAVTPAAVLDGAQINGLAAREVTATSIAVAWRDSFSTVRSEISISPGNQSVVDDADETHRFVGLAPGTLHTITGCAQSSRQVAEGARSCNSISVRTLPSAPGAVDSLSVLPGADPRSRTIRFTDNNAVPNPASSYSVRLFRNGNETVLQQRQVLGTAGPQTHSVDFSGLEPFTDYEVWVIPLNVSGVGGAAGIGFTTPAEVVLSSRPLSGNSALLEFEAKAVGEYIVERRGANGAFTPLSRLLVTGARKHQLVLGGMTGAQRIRLRWRFASLESTSALVRVTPGRRGAPEVVSGASGALTPFSNGPPLQISAVFMPTVSDPAGTDVSYFLRGDLLDGVSRTVGDPLRPPFTAGQSVSISARSQTLLLSPRVCRRTTLRTACSAPLDIGTAGLQRVY